MNSNAILLIVILVASLNQIIFAETDQLSFEDLILRLSHLDSALIGPSEDKMVSALRREESKSDSAFAVLAKDLLQYSQYIRKFDAIESGCTGPFSTVIVRNFHVKEKSKWDSVAIWRFNRSFDDYLSKADTRDLFVKDYIEYIRRYDPYWEPGRAGLPLVCPSWIAGVLSDNPRSTRGIVRSEENDTVRALFKACYKSAKCEKYRQYIFTLTENGRSLYSLDIEYRYAYDPKKFRDALLLELMRTESNDLAVPYLSILKSVDSAIFFELRKNALSKIEWKPSIATNLLSYEYQTRESYSAPLNLFGSYFCNGIKPVGKEILKIKKAIPFWDEKLSCKEQKSARIPRFFK